jgi:hypothetical protein
MKYTREKKLSKAKQTILDMLWSLEPVERKAIFEAVGQTYYDRRIRELRESGWQIETIGTTYQLISRERLPGNEREYLSVEQRRQVSERDGNICQICGTADPHLQFDHKVPQERLGETEVSNMQLLCRTCNVEKRGVCKRCTLTTCDGCPYAYPELFSGRFTIMLDKSLTEKIRAAARQKGLSESALIAEFLKNHYGL